MRLPSGITIVAFILMNASFISAILSMRQHLCQKGKTRTDYMEKTLQIAFSFADIPQWVKRSFIYFDCSVQGLSFIPTKVIPKASEYLNMAENELRKISSADFIGLQNLIILNLQSNCLKYNDPYCKTDLNIEAGAFKDLQNLRILLIGLNFLREFPLELPLSLLYLNIDGTCLGDITIPLLKNANKFKGFSARINCELFYCPNNFNISSEFSDSLEVLILRQDSWRVVPSYLIQDKLQVLDLSLNPVLQLRKYDFVNGTNLRVLMLQGLIDNRLNFITIESGAFDYLVELETLNLAQNNIESIHNNLFRYNTKLKHLDLSRNNLFLYVYNPTFLAHLDLLRYLDISGNAASINIYYSELVLGPSFVNLTSLEILMIGFHSSPLTYFQTSSSVRFDSISDRSIELLASMKNLTILNVAGISLNWLNPSSLQKLSNLKKLDASSNNIQFRFFKRVHLAGKPDEKSLKDRKQTSRNVVKLREFVNEVNIKPAQIIKDDTLQDNCIFTNILNLSYNQISNLTNRLKFLNQACVVDISYNRVQFLNSNDFDNFDNLQMLMLDHNPLHTIHPDSLSTMTQLKVLKMNGIRLSSKTIQTLFFLYNLPSTANIAVRWKDEKYIVGIFFQAWDAETDSTNLNAITTLDISENLLLSSNPNKITMVCQRAVNINLRSCHIFDDMLASPLFPSENVLKWLDLGDNELFQFPIKATETLQSLEVLLLDNNKISNLSGLVNLTSLRKLGLSYNKISYIQPSFFSHSKFKILDLSHNEIARLGHDILSSKVLSHLNFLDIRGNELDCSCGVWDTLHAWIISPESQKLVMPGFVPKCTLDLNLLRGGCVACQSPYHLRSTSLLWYIAHPSCEVSLLSAYAASFSLFSFLFVLFGTLCYSKWINRVIFRKVNQQFRVRSLSRDSVLLENERDQNIVFVVYDLDNDEVGDWVDHRLCQAMNNGYLPIPLKIHGRDNSCGAAPSQQLLRNIINCQKTILLLSNDFCFEKTCRFIFSALQELRYSKGDDHLVLVAWTGENGAPRVPHEIQATLNRKKQYFLRFDSTTDDEEMFFETLRTALLDHC